MKSGPTEVCVAGTEQVQMRTAAKSADVDRPRWRCRDQIGDVRRDQRPFSADGGQSHRRNVERRATVEGRGYEPGDLPPIVLGALAAEPGAESEVVEDIAPHETVA